IDDRGGRQAGEVRAGLGFGALAQAVSPPVQLKATFFVHDLEGSGGGSGTGAFRIMQARPVLLARRDEQLQHRRQDGPRAHTALGRVMRDVTPAQDRQAFLAGDPLDCRPDLRGVAVAGQERHSGRVAPGCWQVEPADLAEERVRDLGGDARAVAGFAIAALGAPVLQVAQDGEGLGDDVMIAATGQVSNEPDAARVVLKAAVVKTLRARQSSRGQSGLLSSHPPSRARCGVGRRRPDRGLAWPASYLSYQSEITCRPYIP